MMTNVSLPTDEKFAPVKGLETRYLIGDRGTVRSVVFGKERERRVVVGKDGYVRVNLADGKGKVVTRYVHRLVAEAFVPKVDGMPDVNHIDMNPQNNSVGNLEWVSHRENILKARAVKGDWGKEARARLCKAIVARNAATGEEKEYPSARAWATQSGNFNRCANVCTAIKTGRVAYGHYWRFKTYP